MSEPTENQIFHLLLADIAMAAAIQTMGPGLVALEGEYKPGAIRDQYLATAKEDSDRKKVLAMANAGVASLQGVDPEQLTRAAAKYGVPINAELADRIALHFSDKREGIIRYRS